jgi:predicted PurR-regulated permease PerM
MAVDRLASPLERVASADHPRSAARRGREVKPFSNTLNTMLIAVIVVAALYFLREVVVPIALAGILSFMLAPLVRRVQKLYVPRALAVMVVVLIAFAAIFALGGIMAREVSQLAGDLPSYEKTIASKIETLQGGGGTGTLQKAQEVLEGLAKRIGRQEQQPAPIIPTVQPKTPTSDQTQLIPVEVHEPAGGPLQTISSLISPLMGPLATTGIIVIFVIFFLIQREDLRDRMIRLAGATDISHTTEVIDDAGHRLSHLFLTQLLINTGFAICISLGLWWIGIPTPFLWGTLAGILRFIPYIGAFIGMVFPLILAVSVDPGWSMLIWTAALFVGLETVTGQVIEPVIEGHSTGLSPVSVVVAATFWSWLWGPVGLVLATPLTVILVVLGRHIEALKFFDVLFGDEPALSEGENFYQRMLAHDPVEAVEQAKSYMAAHSLSDYCDDVARSGLALAQKDAERGRFEEGKGKVFRETVDTLFADIAHEHWLARKEAHAAGIATTSKLPTLQRDQLLPPWRSEAPFVVIGVRSDLDEAAARVLATLVETHGVHARLERAEVLSAANLAKLDLTDVAFVCLSSIDIKTPAHVQFAARRVRSKAPHVKILLGVWSATDEKALEDLREAINADHVARDFHYAAELILQEAAGAPVEAVAVPLTPAAVAG